MYSGLNHKKCKQPNGTNYQNSNQIQLSNMPSCGKTLVRKARLVLVLLLNLVEKVARVLLTNNRAIEEKQNQSNCQIKIIIIIIIVSITKCLNMIGS